MINLTIHLYSALFFALDVLIALELWWEWGWMWGGSAGGGGFVVLCDLTGVC